MENMGSDDPEVTLFSVVIHYHGIMLMLCLRINVFNVQQLKIKPSHMDFELYTTLGFRV